MHKLEEQIRKELSMISDKGLTQGNLEMASKLVDMLKDLSEVKEKGGQEMYGRYRDDYREGYRDYGNYGYRDGSYDRRGGGRYGNSRMREQMGRIQDGMDRYEDGRERYSHGAGEEHRIYEGLEQLMYAVCMFVESAMDFAETPQEKDIIKKHAQKIGRLG